MLELIIALIGVIAAAGVLIREGRKIESAMPIVLDHIRELGPVSQQLLVSRVGSKFAYLHVRLAIGRLEEQGYIYVDSRDPQNPVYRVTRAGWFADLSDGDSKCQSNSSDWSDL